MKITKARLRQIIKEELLKEKSFSAMQAELLKHIKENPGTSLKGAVSGLDGEELTGAIQNLLRDKKITDKGTKGAKYYPIKESKNRISRNEIRRKAMEMIKQPGGISRMDLESGLKDHFGAQLENSSDFDYLEEMVEDTLELKMFNKYYNEDNDHFSTKAGLSENLPPDPNLSDKQNQVVDLIMEDGGLIDLIEKMGSSAPSMLDTYRMLIKAIVASGIRPQALI